MKDPSGQPSSLLKVLQDPWHKGHVQKALLVRPLPASIPLPPSSPPLHQLQLPLLFCLVCPVESCLRALAPAVPFAWRARLPALCISDSILWFPSQIKVSFLEEASLTPYREYSDLPSAVARAVSCRPSAVGSPWELSQLLSAPCSRPCSLPQAAQLPKTG